MTDEKPTQQAKIRKGLPPKRNPESYQLQQDITIPAGSILRNVSGNEYEINIGAAPGSTAKFSLTVAPGGILPASVFKRVIAS